MVNIKRVASDSGIALRCKVPLMLSSYARSMNMSGSSGGFFNGIQQVTDHHVSSSSQAPRSAIATTTSAVPSSTNPGTVTPATSNEEFIMDLMQTLYERVERLESEVLAFRESRLMAPLSATAVPSSSNEAAKSSVPPSKRAKRNKN